MDIYTDGSCDTTLGIGGWAFYIPELNMRVGNKAHNTTNNRMELIAVIKALEFIQDCGIITSFTIYSDSLYVIEGINGNWKIQTNDDLWGKLFFYKDLLDYLTISYVHVKGHNGDKNNEIVDKLAVQVRKLWEK